MRINWLTLSWHNLSDKWLNTLLNIVLLSFGIGIIAVLLLISAQMENKLVSNAKGIDAVVGAKGSPLQLILSSVYHVDFPTGNIPLKEAQEIMRNPMVKQAVPLSLGDSYEGYRIVGTNSGFVDFYQLELSEGRIWKNNFEVCLGANIAKVKGLQLGDRFTGSHGLTQDGHSHDENNYAVVGIFEKQGSVTDNLIVTSTQSVWAMHGLESPETPEHHEEGHQHENEVHRQEGKKVLQHSPLAIKINAGPEITSLLIRYRSPASIVAFPAYINSQTSLQAASPAKESARLFSLMGTGMDVLKWFAYLVIVISAFSVFIGLYNSMKERKYSLAIMRSMGASKGKLFGLTIAEGLLLTGVATLVGLAWAHLAVEIIGNFFQDAEQSRLTGKMWLNNEFSLLFGGLGIGVLAALLPAIQAYKTDIANVLSKG